MHDHACIKQAAHTLHIRNPIVYTFHFCPGRGEAAVVHARVKCYDGCAPSALPRQGPHPAWKLLPLALFCFSLSTRKTEASRTPPPPSGGRADSSKQGRPIHPNNRYIQICKNLILSAVDNQLLLRH